MWYRLCYVIVFQKQAVAQCDLPEDLIATPFRAWIKLKLKKLGFSPISSLAEAKVYKKYFADALKGVAI